MRVAPGIPLLLCILLVRVVAVPVCCLCRSVSLPLARPAGFAFFSPFFPLPGRGRGSEVAMGSLGDGRCQTMTVTELLQKFDTMPHQFVSFKCWSS